MNHETTAVNKDHPEPNITKIAGILMVGFVIVLFLVVTGVGSYFFFKGVVSAEINRKEITGMSRELAALRIKEAENLNTYGWINKDKGIVQVPIEVAKGIIIKNYNK